MAEKAPQSQDFSWNLTPDGPLFDYAPPEEQYEVTRWFMDLVRKYSVLTLSSAEIERQPFTDFDERWQPFLDIQRPGSD
jgi:hypothetical protein